ncbi:MAG: hypothetical protein HC836_40420 [Richelia sp. RM2_1_2]|nr:hypothetical protein [Richelia sp. RM2_1_2]
MASIAVYSTRTIPQLGFIHEASGNAFMIDVADLYRTSVTIPVAFLAFRNSLEPPYNSVFKNVRHLLSLEIKHKKMIDTMIKDIEDLLE